MNRALQLRIDRGLTLAQVGEATGISKQTVSNLENSRGAHPSTLKTLGDYYKVPASSLLMPAIDAERAA